MAKNGLSNMPYSSKKKKSEYSKKRWKLLKSNPKKLKEHYKKIKKWTEANKEKRAVHVKRWRDKNKETIKNQRRSYYKKNKEKLLISQRRRAKARYHLNDVTFVNRRLKYNYGITLDDYTDLAAKQEGCCAICGYCSLELNKRLVVDHCHKTSNIRGLLCSYCNSMLGFARDNLKNLKKAIAYLKKHK